MVGRGQIESHSGRIERISILQALSTTDIIKRILHKTPIPRHKNRDPRVYTRDEGEVSDYPIIL